MWWPCFHHVLELVLGAVIQQRWKTGGPRDAIYTRFKAEWPNLLAAMPEITDEAKEKVNLFNADDDITRELRQRTTSLLKNLIGTRFLRKSFGYDSITEIFAKRRNSFIAKIEFVDNPLLLFLRSYTASSL